MNIDDIKRKLLVKYPLFGSIIANVKFIEESLVETAGTDAENIYYNPEFISNLTDAEQIFIFAHEVCHIAFNHIYRSEGKNHELWNIATDSVVNAHLKNDGLPLVKGGVDIPEAINYEAEEMYNKLLEEKEKKHNSNQKGGSEENKQNYNSNSQRDNDNINQGSSNNSNGQGKSKTNSNNSEKTQEKKDVGHDTHSMWDKAIEKKHKQENGQSTKEEKDKHNEKSLLDKLFNRKNKKQDNQHINDINNKEVKKSDEDKKKLTDMGEKEAFKQNKAERKKQLEELRQNLASQSYGAGNSTNSTIRNISNIGQSKPLIDWRYVLKEAIKYDVDWSYQNATIEDGVLNSHLEEMPRPETEIVLDTSGSIDENLLKNFLRECKNILQTSNVKVGCFDTQFYGFTEIKDISDIDNLSFYGGGGTNFDVAVNAFTKRVENKIIFTDGKASMPSNKVDAIWIVFGNRKINPPGGKVIYITPEQLDRLYSYEIEGEIKGRAR